jgi:hypothetical protein
MWVARVLKRTEISFSLVMRRVAVSSIAWLGVSGRFILGFLLPGFADALELD